METFITLLYIVSLIILLLVSFRTPLKLSRLQWIGAIILAPLFLLVAIFELIFID